MTNLTLKLSVATAIVLSASAGAAQTVQENVKRSFGWSDPTDEATEIRVWLGGVLRVQTVYRIVNRGNTVLVEKIAWTRIEQPIQGETTAAEARRETRRNRQLLREGRCISKIVETAGHLWCRLAAGDPTYWPSVFADLLPDELWKLPPDGERSCKEDSRGQKMVVLDGEVVGIEIVERGRRHSVEYANPDICCATLACAVAGRVRQVVRNLQ